MSGPTKPVSGSRQKTSVNERLEEVLQTMKNWGDLTQKITGPCPAEIIVAIASGRPEVAKLANERELTKEECRTLFDIIHSLLETNSALQLHAQLLSQKTKQWSDHFKGIHRTAEEIECYANFREPEIED